MLPLGLRNLAGTSEESLRVGNVLENIEHENQVERSVGYVRLVEFGDTHVGPPPTALLHCVPVRFDALHTTELLERIEEQRGAAADIKNPGPSDCPEDAPNLTEQDFFANAPPPVLPVQLGVCSGVLSVH